MTLKGTRVPGAPARRRGAPVGPMGRVAVATRGAVSALNYLEEVMAEEGVTLPPKVRAALATMRVWCRDTGAKHRNP